MDNMNENFFYILRKTSVICAIYLALLVSLIGCNKDNEPTTTPDNTPKVTNMAVNSTVVAADSLNSAAISLNNANVTGVVVDMSGVNNGIVSTTDANWNAIVQSMGELAAAAQTTDKPAAVVIPTINVGDSVNIPYAVYKITASSAAKANTMTAMAAKSMTVTTLRSSTADASASIGGNHSNLKLTGQNSRVHFLGAFPTSDAVATDTTANYTTTGTNQVFTTDTILINSDGMGNGSILNYVKPTAAINVTTPTNGAKYWDWNASNIIGKTLGDRVTPVNGDENLQLNYLNDHLMQQVIFPNRLSPSTANVNFTTVPWIDNIATDTVSMGGQWVNGVYTADPTSWALKYGDSYFKYRDPATFRTTITSASGGNIILHTPNGVASMEEMTEFFCTQVVNSHNANNVVSDKPLTVNVPAQNYIVNGQEIDGVLVAPGQLKYYPELVETDPIISQLGGFVQWWEYNGLNISNVFGTDTVGLTVNSR